jgi:protein-S-isoprenylcysteine O-methyltransferase
VLRLITYALAFGYWGYEFYLLFRRRAKGDSTKTDRGTIRLAWFLIVGGCISGFLIARPLRFLSWPSTRLAVISADAVLASGIVLRVWSIRHLGRFFTVQVSVQTDQKIVDTGPYQYIRHPSYTGSLLAFFGVGLLTFNFAGCLLIVVCVLLAYVLRIRVEEQVLHTHFGEAYAEYARRTKRLIPGVY